MSPHGRGRSSRRSRGACGSSPSSVLVRAGEPFSCEEPGELVSLLRDAVDGACASHHASLVNSLNFTCHFSPAKSTDCLPQHALRNLPQAVPRRGCEAVEQVSLHYDAPHSWCGTRSGSRPVRTPRFRCRSCRLRPSAVGQSSALGHVNPQVRIPLPEPPGTTVRTPCTAVYALSRLCAFLHKEGPRAGHWGAPALFPPPGSARPLAAPSKAQVITGSTPSQSQHQVSTRPGNGVNPQEKTGRGQTRRSGPLTWVS